MERDFDSDSNFEERLIEDEERNDQRYYTTQLLLSTQGLGGIEKINQEGKYIDLYVKGENAESCLKHLCLQCRKDIPDRPLAKYYLYKYGVLEKHLLNLLTGYPQDKILSFYIMILLESMTNIYQSGVRLQNTTAQEMLQALQHYKLNFMRPLVLETLMNHLHECVSINAELRKQTHNQMIELIVLLFRNLLQIPDLKESNIGVQSGGEIIRNLQRNFIQAILKESVISAMIFMSQEFTTSLMQKLCLPLVECFYFIFTPFDQDWLLRDAADDKLYTMKNLQKQFQNKQQKLMEIPTRHSRFAGLFITKRQHTLSGQISSEPFHTHQVNKLANQRQKPMARAIVAKQETIFPKNLTLDAFDHENEKNMKEELRTMTIDFLMHGFSSLIECAFNEMNKEGIEVNDKIHYFVLMAYFMKFTRLYAKKNQERHVKDKELSSEYVYVSAGLSLTQFNLIYSNLLHESTQLKKKNFNYRNYFATITVLLEYLQIIKEFSLSIQQVDRKNSSILMQNVFTHDISKAIRIGFSYCQYGLFNDVLLKNLILLTSLFYDLLESYSQGKTLSIRTNKLLKKKIKKNKKKQDKQQERYENEEFNEEQPPISESDTESEEDEDEPIYKERRCNLISEFAIVVEYSVLQKYFYLIKDKQILLNPSELNIAVYKYFKRIVDLLKAEWIFFQVDFLYIINSILQNKFISYKSEFNNLLQLFRRISLSFMQLFKANKLVAVEILFRFPDVATKESIIKNYADVQDDTYPQIEQVQQPQHTVWTQVEDKALIDNYERFKDLEKPEEQLCLILNNLGFSMKSPQEIKKRLKKFRLHEGSAVAIAKYHELYEKLSMKKEEIMAKSVKELLIEVGEIALMGFFDELFDQLIKYIEYRGNELVEMPIPPITREQFDFFEKQSIQQILIGLDIKQPQQGEMYWRLQPYQFEQHIREMKQVLQKYLNRAKLIKDEQLIEEYQPLQLENQQEKEFEEYQQEKEFDEYQEQQLLKDDEEEEEESHHAESHHNLRKQSKSKNSEISDHDDQQSKQSKQQQQGTYDDIFD